MSDNIWFAYCNVDARAQLKRAARLLDPTAQLIFMPSGLRLRSLLQEEVPKRYAVIIGSHDNSKADVISGINLAAAVARDGLASRVVLVAQHPSAELASHVKTAGIDKLIDMASLEDARPANNNVSEQSVDQAAEKLAQDKADPAVKPRALDTLPSCGATPTAQHMTPYKKDQSYVVAPQTDVFADELPGGSFDCEHKESCKEEPHSQKAVGEAHHLSTYTEHHSPVYVFGSGRGGVGKTALAATMAVIAASWGMKVALFDLDLACGNLFSLFGLPRGAGLEALLPEVAKDGSSVNPLGGSVSPANGSINPASNSVNPACSLTAERLDEVGIAVTEHLRLWGPCARPESFERISPLVESLLHTAAKTYDVVLVDTSNTCTDAVAQAFQLCDRLLLVHDEYMGGFGSLARTSALAVRLGVARARIMRIANRGDRRTKFDLMAGRAEVGLETARAMRVLEGGPEIAELLAAGKARELVDLDSDFVSSVAHILAQLLSDAGKLPDVAAAQAALASARTTHHPFRLFRKKASS